MLCHVFTGSGGVSVQKANPSRPTHCIADRMVKVLRLPQKSIHILLCVFVYRRISQNHFCKKTWTAPLVWSSPSMTLIHTCCTWLERCASLETTLTLQNIAQLHFIIHFAEDQSLQCVILLCPDLFPPLCPFCQGDGNIRYYEISSEKPYVHYLTEYRSLLPQKGMGEYIWLFCFQQHFKTKPVDICFL